MGSISLIRIAVKKPLKQLYVSLLVNKSVSPSQELNLMTLGHLFLLELSMIRPNLKKQTKFQYISRVVLTSWRSNRKKKTSSKSLMIEKLEVRILD